MVVRTPFNRPIDASAGMFERKVLDSNRGVCGESAVLVPPRRMAVTGVMLGWPAVPQTCQDQGRNRC